MATPTSDLRRVRRFIVTATRVLRATRWRRLVGLADKIEHWARSATRRRFVVVLVYLVAFTVAAKPLFSAAVDSFTLVNERVLGWGYCYERDPSSRGFNARRYRRSCVADQISLFTWQDGPRASGCTDCDNRAAQLVVGGEGRSQVWVEYYLEKGRWLPGHVWAVAHARLVPGWHLEGIVLQRIDHGIRVCNKKRQPLTLEVFLPLDAGRGCQSPSLWGYAAPFARLDRWLDRIWRGYGCPNVTNTFYVRWLTSDAKPNVDECWRDEKDTQMFRADAKAEWQPGAKITVIRRD